MKIFKKKVLKSSNGITLIALVITIIVLLILAGISIAMLAGNNGVLQKATNAKQTSERAEAKEQAQMDIMAYIADKTANHQDTSLDDEKVKEILTGKSYVKNGQPGNDSFFTAKGEYEIPYSELYTASLIIPPSSGQKLKDIITRTDYGKSINYSVTVSGKTLNNWKVFFNDGNNVYIILGDLLEASLIPDSAGLNTDPTQYKHSVWSNANSSENLTNSLTTIDNWEDFAKGVSGATATGSPTKEQLEQSYGQGTLDYKEISGELYVPPTNTENYCNSYWLASRSLTWGDPVWVVTEDSTEAGKYRVHVRNYKTTGTGLRPLVKLPSNASGTVDLKVTIDK